MQRRHSILCTALLGLALVLSWSGNALAQPLKVGVTIAPQAWLVQQIGGPLVEVETLVPAGSDPHTYEPKPSQMTALSQATLYLSIGVDFEHAWLPRIQGAAPNMAVAEMDHGVEKIAMAAHEHGHGHDHGEEVREEHGHGHAAYTDGRSHGEYDDHEKHQAEGRQWMDRHGTLDPHVWTDPANMLIMAKNTFEALQDADTRNSETYFNNYKAARKRIESVQLELMKRFAAAQGRGRAFMVFHPAWGYFARAHALTQVPIEVEGKEPSPRELAEIVQEAKDEKVAAIFVQPQRSDKAAQVVANEIGAKVVVADPLAYDWEANLLRVAREFERALY